MHVSYSEILRHKTICSAMWFYNKHNIEKCKQCINKKIGP